MDQGLVTTRSGAALRREQILEAARACFQAHGFHAATMAQIAASARLSVGQIYRYFDNKEAIVAAIVQGCLADFARGMAVLATRHHGRLDVVAQELEEMIATGAAPDECRLILEVRAEAARNDKIRLMMACADAELARHLHDLLATTCLVRLDPAELDRRVEMIRLITEGSLARFGDTRNNRCSQRDGVLAGLLRTALAAPVDDQVASDEAAA